MPNMWMAAGALMAQDLIEATQWGQVVDIQCSKDATPLKPSINAGYRAAG
jgi:hypothetical protein